MTHTTHSCSDHNHLKKERQDREILRQADRQKGDKVEK